MDARHRALPGNVDPLLGETATLDETGLDVVTALGARAAIEIAGRDTFDAYLVDLEGFAGRRESSRSS